MRVNIDQASSEVWTGSDNAAPGGRWMSLQPGPTDPSAAITAATEAATEAFKVAANADSLKRLRRILSGDPRLRVHYPRVATGATGTPPPPTPENKNYEWFVNDEKADGGAQPTPPGMAEGDDRTKREAHCRTREAHSRTTEGEQHRDGHEAVTPRCAV